MNVGKKNKKEKSQLFIHNNVNHALLIEKKTQYEFPFINAQDSLDNLTGQNVIMFGVY